MIGGQQDQEEEDFNIFDNFECHEDDWFDFYEESFTFQCLTSNQEEINNSMTNTIKCKDSLSFDISKSPSGPIQFQQDQLSQDKQIIKKHKKPKTKVILTPAAEQFRRRLYRLLSNGEKKIVRKQYVFFYHSLICDKCPSIRDVRREEYRSIGNYFNAFSSQQNSILQAIRELKKNGIPEIQHTF